MAIWTLPKKITATVAGVDFGSGESETLEGHFYKCQRCAGWVNVKTEEDLDSHIHESTECDQEMVRGIMET